jgi:hypothetical protein
MTAKGIAAPNWLRQHGVPGVREFSQCVHSHEVPNHCP